MGKKKRNQSAWPENGGENNDLSWDTPDNGWNSDPDWQPKRRKKKKKKGGSALPVIVCACVVLILAAVVGYFTVHTWTDATCTTAEVCKICGKTRGGALGHDWTEATCTDPAVCKVCGVSAGSAPGHDWLSATRTAPKTCSVCGATEGELLSREEAYPEGKLRFENGRFLMDSRDFLEMYTQDLAENGFDFMDTRMYDDLSDSYRVYYLMNNDGWELDVTVTTDTDTGLIQMISVIFEMDEDDLDKMTIMMNAAMVVYETCHGAMTDQKWTEMGDPEITYAYDCTLMRYKYDDLGMVIAYGNGYYELMVTPDMTSSLMQ